MLAGTVLLTATAASFPLLSHWWVGHLTAKDAALSAAQVRRGAFMNSGTKDMGRDPQWDFEKGMHKQKILENSGYAAIAEAEKKEQEQHLPGVAQAMDPTKMAKYEKDLEAFAKGKKRPNT